MFPGLESCQPCAKRETNRKTKSPNRLETVKTLEKCTRLMGYIPLRCGEVT